MSAVQTKNHNWRKQTYREIVNEQQWALKLAREERRQVDIDRESIAADVDAFLARGGRIQEIPFGVLTGK